MSNIDDATVSKAPDRLDIFMLELEEELRWRHDMCDGPVTPEAVLLTVLNAVAAARAEAKPK